MTAPPPPQSYLFPEAPELEAGAGAVGAFAPPGASTILRAAK